MLESVGLAEGKKSDSTLPKAIAALEKNFFCFVAPRFALPFSLRQRGMKILLT